MNKSLVPLAAGLVALGGLGVFALTRSRGGPPPPATTSSAPSSVASAPPAPSAPLPGPIVDPGYDCSRFGNRKELPPPEDVPGLAAVRELQRLSRWDAVSVMTCAVSPPLTKDDHARLGRAIGALNDAALTTASMPVLERAVAQNAALRVAHCARSIDPAGKVGPSDKNVDGLRKDALGLVRKLAFGPEELDALGRGFDASLGDWFSAKALAAAAAPRQRVAPGVHERAAAFAWIFHSVPREGDVDAFYGSLVVVDRDGAAHPTSIPARVVLRRAEGPQLTLCFAEPSIEHLRERAVLAPVAHPVGPLKIGAARCDGCHRDGHRMSDAANASIVPGGSAGKRDPVLAAVDSWYRDASAALK